MELSQIESLKQRITLLRAALESASCDYGNLSTAARQYSLKILNGPGGHLLWCSRCKALEATK